MPLENPGKKENKLEEMKLKLQIHLSTYPCSQLFFSHGAHSQVQQACGRQSLPICCTEKSIPSFVCNAEKKGKDILNLCFVQLKIEVPFCFLLSVS